MSGSKTSLTGCQLEGDAAIFEKRKTAFFCSRRFPSAAMLKVYDWAKEAILEERCVISGFHTSIEEDVWKMLLKGGTPMIWVCARDMLSSKYLFPETKAALERKQLLIVSPFEKGERRMTKELSSKRNRFVMDVANSIVVGHAYPGGRLQKDLEAYTGGMEITWLS